MISVTGKDIKFMLHYAPNLKLKKNHRFPDHFYIHRCGNEGHWSKECPRFPDQAGHGPHHGGGGYGSYGPPSRGRGGPGGGRGGPMRGAPYGGRNVGVGQGNRLLDILSIIP